MLIAGRSQKQQQLSPPRAAVLTSLICSTSSWVKILLLQFCCFMPSAHLSKLNDDSWYWLWKLNSLPGTHVNSSVTMKHGLIFLNRLTDLLLDVGGHWKMSQRGLQGGKWVEHCIHFYCIVCKLVKEDLLIAEFSRSRCTDCGAAKTKTSHSTSQKLHGTLFIRSTCWLGNERNPYYGCQLVFSPFHPIPLSYYLKKKKRYSTAGLHLLEEMVFFLSFFSARFAVMCN